MEFRISNDPIDAAQYRHLREKCGLSGKTEQAAAIGLKNSIFSVKISVGHHMIGMGRIVGDGGCSCQVVDICVDPEFQGRGLGKRLVENLMDFVERELPDSCYISLIADGPAAMLYEKFGFRETMPESRGMFKRKN